MWRSCIVCRAVCRGMFVCYVCVYLFSTPIILLILLDILSICFFQVKCLVIVTKK